MGPTLRQAAEEGDMEKLTNVLAFNPDMVYSITLDKQNTALHIAASNGHYRFVHHFLISVGVDAQLVISKNLDEETPLQLAVREGHGEVVEHLIKYQVWASNIKNIKHQRMCSSTIMSSFMLPHIQGTRHRRRPWQHGTAGGPRGHGKATLACICGTVAADEKRHEAASTRIISKLFEADLDAGMHALAYMLRRGVAMRTSPIVDGDHDDLYACVVSLVERSGMYTIPNPYMHEALRASVEEGNIHKMLELTVDQGISMFFTVTPEYLNNVLHIAALKGDVQFVHHVLLYVTSYPSLLSVEHNTLGFSPKDITSNPEDGIGCKYDWKSSHMTHRSKNHLMATMIKVDKYGNSVMHEAVLNLMSDIALQLLDVDPSCAHRLNSAMQSPLYISINSGLDHVVNKIAKQGLSAASVTTHGTALHQSVLGDNIITVYKRVIRELLKQCPDLSEVLDKAGQNIFHVAVLADRPRILSWFLRYVLHAEMVNQQDLNGDTPLHLAAKNVFIQPARLLLKDPRVNRNIVNRDWYTALDISREKALIRSELNAYQLNIWKEMFKRQEIMSEPPHNDSIWQRPMGGRVGPPSDDEVRIYVYIVVAAFITMATFRATFTMPGRYDPRSGFAIAGHHWAFKLSVLCNTTSTCSSALVVLLLIAQWHSATWIVLDALVWANRFIILALFTMVVSMLMAIYLTVLPSS
uniref:PGG domain-containing protein n=1 Tax=Oryza brachyantha TaxID=4533 RepID=J3KV63_ORYBR